MALVLILLVALLPVSISDQQMALQGGCLSIFSIYTYKICMHVYTCTLVYLLCLHYVPRNVINVYINSIQCTTSMHYNNLQRTVLYKCINRRHGRVVRAYDTLTMFEAAACGRS